MSRLCGTCEMLQRSELKGKEALSSGHSNGY